MSIRIRTNRQDELGRLTESFNQMTGDLQKYLDDTVQKQKDLNKTTLKLYQTQLNPHFLYNTLDSIKWNARINQVPEIAVLAENLAVILRKAYPAGPLSHSERSLRPSRAMWRYRKYVLQGGSCMRQRYRTSWRTAWCPR